MARPTAKRSARKKIDMEAEEEAITMKVLTTLIVLGLLASSVLAQPGDRSQIDIKARVKGTTDWLDVVNVAPIDASSPVEIEVGVFCFRHTGYGFSTTVTTFITNNWLLGDVVTLIDRADSVKHPDGRRGNFNFGNQSQDKYTTGIDAGRLRVAASGNTGDAIGGGVSIKQNTPVALGGSFDSADGVLAFRFDMTLNNPTPGVSNFRTLVCDAPLSKINSYSVYDTPSSTTATSIKAALLPTHAATITITWQCAGSIVIDQQPVSQSVPGGPASFVVHATGPNIEYRWRKDSVPLNDNVRISGSGTPMLHILQVESADLGSYDCVVSNGCAPVVSDSASLTCMTPEIIVQPLDRATVPGQTAIFVVAVSGINLDFLWLKNGTPLTDGGRISGSSLPTLSIANVQVTDQAAYECVVFNSCSGVTSAAAHLTCSPIIIQQPPLTIPLRAGAVLSVGVPAGSAQSFRWRRDGQNLFNVPGLFSGVTTKTLTFLSNDPSIPGGFDCVLTNSCGTVTSAVSTINCPADFDMDGFVTGEDFDSYHDAFAAGDVSSDFDGDGFVTGEDFDAYVAAFVEGC